MNGLDDLHKIELIIMGDLNWDYSETKGVGYRNLKELENEYGIEQYVKEPTRLTERGGTLIEVILKNVYRY